MYRNVIAMAFVAVVFVAGRAQAIDMIWDGEDGAWTDANWNGGMSPSAVVGRDDGTEGAEDNIIIGEGNVLYDANEIGSDFRMLQGNTLTIGGGASWTQLTLPDWSENRWTEMDLSELTLDNGSFNRIGEGPGDGGGALIFGSWKGDDNFDQVPPPQEINISLANGGNFLNEGQVWFGGGEDHPPGLIVNVTINDGSFDLTGGDITADDAVPPAEWLMFFDYDEDSGQPKGEEYTVNFTGPGSITVDRSGIIVPFQLDTGEWTNLEAVEYEDLWENGILKANGMDVNSEGASFAEFFMVEGELGSDDYKLISLVGTELAGDVNLDGRVDVADLNIIGLNWRMSDKTRAEGDLNADTIVDAADLNIMALDWQEGVPAGAAVPEPSTAALLLTALLGCCGILRKRRC